MTKTKPKKYKFVRGDKFYKGLELCVFLEYRGKLSRFLNASGMIEMSSSRLMKDDNGDLVE